MNIGCVPHRPTYLQFTYLIMNVHNDDFETVIIIANCFIRPFGSIAYYYCITSTVPIIAAWVAVWYIILSPIM